MVLIGIFDYHSTFIVFGRRFRVLLQISNGLVILDITRYPSESSSALILSIRLTRPLFPFMSRHLLTPVFFERLIRANWFFPPHFLEFFFIAEHDSLCVLDHSDPQPPYGFVTSDRFPDDFSVVLPIFG